VKSTGLSLLLSLSLLAPALALPPAQTPEDYFHMGVTNYCRTNIVQARKDVTNGLVLYPNNPWLTNLWELLKQQQQQNKNKDKDSKDQQSKDQQKQDQEKQDQQKQQEQQKQNEQKKKEEEQKKKEEEQKAADQQKKDGEDKQGQQGSPDQQKEDEEKAGDPQGVKMLRMTPQQAMRLLDMLKSDEKNMPFRPILRTNRHQRVFKDW
jgi:outer membrane biosynthesis protein TonB